MRSTARRAAPVVLAFVCLSSSLYFARTAELSRQNKNAQQGNRPASVLFAKHCDTCHGKDGQAKTFKAKFNHARNLTDPQWQAGVSDEHLYNSISNGRGKMPAWGKKLSEAEINSLVAYVRGLKK
jgi:cytochrome c oxidase cbb3-type subunit III